MKKIAVVNDLSGLGKCSLTAAIPVISVMGVQACPFPTAILSNQTGFASYYCQDYTDRMDRMAEEWKKCGFIPDGIYTGFLAGEDQAEKVLDFLKCFGRPETLVLTDPVMGDHGKAHGFYTDGFCRRMRLLCSQAHVLTPNLTEALLLLYGKEGMERIWQELMRKEKKEFLFQVETVAKELAEQFSLKAAVITGVDLTEPGKSVQIGNLVWEQGKGRWFFSEKYGGSYSGTGDLFASVLSAGLVKGFSMKHCVELAVEFLICGIRDAVQEGTDRNEGICFEPYLHLLWENNIGANSDKITNRQEKKI